MFYALLAVAVIATGLLWRSGLIPMPPALSNYGGDALWALMVFVGLGFLLPRTSTAMITLLALAFSWGIEFSQLYHAPWIDAIRATLPGRLVLGSTFNWPDLLAFSPSTPISPPPVRPNQWLFQGPPGREQTPSSQQTALDQRG